jgi:magnesium-transporting ATPase (P-type)
LPALIEALALCHNVTPVKDEEEELIEKGDSKRSIKNEQKKKELLLEVNGDFSINERKDSEEEIEKYDSQCQYDVGNVWKKKEKNYQSSSPDEIALVKIAKDFGIELLERDQKKIRIQLPCNKILRDYEILANFPFSSENKRMGIGKNDFFLNEVFIFKKVLRNLETSEIFFYLKGADSIMKQFVAPSAQSFLQEECENLAREGLRTLVFSYKKLEEEEWSAWKQDYDQSCLAMDSRDEKISTKLFQ